jgi:HEAT repeat protein
MVMDFTRNERLFRFERYIKTVQPKSHDQIPALIEAMGYKDYRFYEPATEAMIKMKTALSGYESRAVSILAGHLHSCSYNAKSLKTTIFAIGSLGPYAAEAVPGLIEQLKCQGTNTYEVTPMMIRWAAVNALGNIGPAAADAVPALTEALSEPSGFVREASRHALRSIGRGSATEDRKKQYISPQSVGR